MKRPDFQRDYQSYVVAEGMQISGLTAPTGIRIFVSGLVLAAVLGTGCAGRIGIGSNKSKDVTALIDRKEIESDRNARNNSKEKLSGHETNQKTISEEESRKLLKEAIKYVNLAKALLACASIMDEVSNELNSKTINPANLQSLLLRLTKIEDMFLKEKPLDPKAERSLIVVQKLIQRIKFVLDKNIIP